MRRGNETWTFGQCKGSQKEALLVGNGEVRLLKTEIGKAVCVCLGGSGSVLA